MQITKLIFQAILFIPVIASAHGPQPTPLQNVPIPSVPGLLDSNDPIVIDKAKAIVLGKALFWDVNVGSDGMACASCHFHAGADRRVKNQLNPGQKGLDTNSQTFQPLVSGVVGGPNYTLSAADFPSFDYHDPLLQSSGISFTSDDVVGSAGTFSGEYASVNQFSGMNDQCKRAADPIFHIGAVGSRRVEPRNAPSVINAVFNHRNFWDGRANNIYNGFSPWGERDPNNGLWLKTGARSVIPYRLHLENSSLASQAMAPALNNVEMSCNQRNWPEIGRKLLLRQPLQNQAVHHADSVLGVYSLSSLDKQRPGLNTTYKNLIMQAFNTKFWSFSGSVPIQVPSGHTPYNQMEANFSMFFGLALQLYQSTLISDQSEFDLSPRDPITLEPTWQGLGKTADEISALTDGYETFSAVHCNLCHSGPAFTKAAIVLNSTLVTPKANSYYGPADSPIAYGLNAFGDGLAGQAAGISQNISLITRDTVTAGSRLLDFGFANTGVNDPNTDPGIAGIDDFGHPLSFADQYVDYLLGQYAAVLDPGVKTVRSCDFIVPLSVNIPASFPDKFSSSDGIQLDGSRENNLRQQNCNYSAYIPTIAAANAALISAPAKLAVSKQGVFKVPSLRNVELTGPYMHNGGMATLEQVVEFYTRKGNFNNPDKHLTVNQVLLQFDAGQRADLVAFLKSLTDNRVRYEKAPFDHPAIAVPNGQVGDNRALIAGNAMAAGLAKDEYLLIPAVGADGSPTPLLGFDTYLAQ